MNYEDLIKKYLPQDLRPKATADYTIPPQFLESMPDLIEMILRSKSMDADENEGDKRQGWFNLMPLMNEEQIGQLRAILVREKEKLAEIEKKYEEKKLEIKKKYLLRRQNMGYIKKVNEIKAQEAEHAAKEQAEADSLLASL